MNCISRVYRDTVNRLLLLTTDLCPCYHPERNHVLYCLKKSTGKKKTNGAGVIYFQKDVVPERLHLHNGFQLRVSLDWEVMAV